MRLATTLVLLAAAAHTAHADLPEPIAVKSVGAPGAGKTLWKIVAGDHETWCKPASALTITLVGKPLLSDIVLAVDATIASVEVVADGTSMTSSPSDGKVDIPLKSRAYHELVVHVTGTGCVNQITLGDGPVVYAADASTLWADLAAARAAIAACDKKQIAQTFAFPFRVTWPDMDEHGMKWPHTTYTSADKLATNCKNIHVKDGIVKIEPVPKLESQSTTSLHVIDDQEMRWELVYAHKHWRVQAFAYAGA